MSKNEALNYRVNFVGFIDITGGCPNGDPDCDNAPRIDVLTNRGMITNGCIKRKLRNYVDITKKGTEGYDIYVRRGTALDTNEQAAIDATGASKILATKNPDMAKIGTSVRDYLCDRFYDIRAFGGVLTRLKANNITGSALRGPVWITDAISVSPIQYSTVTMTRCCPQKEVSIIKNAKGEEKEGQKQGDFGHRYVVPYGLYRFNGGINALDCQITGFSQADLDFLIEAMLNGFEYDMASNRVLRMKKLVVFKHDSEYVSAGTQSYVLENLVRCEKICADEYPGSYEDYRITVDTDKLPKGVTCDIII